MKTYTSSYTPVSVKSLCGIRKVDIDAAEQAIDATLTGLKVTTEFTGLSKVQGEKGEHNAVMESIARMPAGTIKDVLLYFGKVHKAERACKPIQGVLTLSDFPATVSAWFNGFSTESDAAKAADKAAKDAEKDAKKAAKDAAKKALEETRKQVEAGAAK